MFGGSKAPYLLPKYATDYVVHKEVVRQIYIDGIGNFLFDMKKAVYPPLHLCIGSYKFTRVKSAPEFVKEIEYFHFGEKSFHRNDLENKVENYCATIGVHFEYTNYWDKDEEIFHNSCSIATLRRRFKQKIEIVGGKGRSSKDAEQQKKEEEDAKKREEESHILLQDAEQQLV